MAVETTFLSRKLAVRLELELEQPCVEVPVLITSPRATRSLFARFANNGTKSGSEILSCIDHARADDGGSRAKIHRKGNGIITGARLHTFLFF